MSIGISSSSDDDDIRIVGSLFCGNDEFSFLLYQSLRGRPFAKRWKHPWGAKQSILCFLRHLDCHVNRHRIRLISRNDGNRGRFSISLKITDYLCSFSIMDYYPIAIFCEYFLKHFDNIISIIRNRKDSIIFLTLERDIVRLEPLTTFSGRKFPECFFDKISSSSILGEENFFVIDSCCQITSSSTR